MPDEQIIKLGTRQKNALLWVAGRTSAAKVTPSSLQDLVRLKLIERDGSARSVAFKLTTTGQTWLDQHAP